MSRHRPVLRSSDSGRQVCALFFWQSLTLLVNVSRNPFPWNPGELMSTFGLIEYKDASSEVRAIYDDIMATRKTVGSTFLKPHRPILQS
jgi:hypothetical protein